VELSNGHRCFFTRERYHDTYRSLLLKKETFVQLRFDDVLQGHFVSTYDLHLALDAFGTEFCNFTIFNEITKIISSGGTVNSRHILLVSDVMLMHGSLNAFHRHAFQKIKSVNTFEQASFEQTVDCFKKAAFFGNKFSLSSVSDNIICGQLFAGGTNAMNLVCLDTNSDRNSETKPQKKKRDMMKTIIRKEWSMSIGTDDTMNECPVSPVYCPMSPVYNDEESLYDSPYESPCNGLKYGDTEELSSRIDTGPNVSFAEDNFRLQMANNLGNIFHPPSPIIENDRVVGKRDIVENNAAAFEFIRSIIN